MPLLRILAFGSLVAASAGVYAADRAPNILFILADDVGCETLGCYGGRSYSTPRLDRLAEEGIRFRHAYSMPVCHPTRICFLTGRYPFRLGHPRWGSFPPEAEPQTVAQVLRRVGYRTAVAGKWQLTLLGEDLDHPHRLGFDEYCLFGWHEGPRYYQPHIWQNGKLRDDVGGRYGPDVYCDFLIDFMTREGGQPWFAFYSMALCHDVTDDLAEPVPYGPRGRWDSYREMVEGMDDRVGRILDALERRGIAEQTLVVFTADNGTPKASYIRADGDLMIREPVVSMLGRRPIAGGKGNLTDDGTRVPLIVRQAGRGSRGRISDALVDHTDFLPTFADLAGAALPDGVKLDGRSFSGVLAGEEEGRPWVYADRGADRGWVRIRRYKLYRDGTFFDVDQDPEERKPIAAGDAAGAYSRLAEAWAELGSPPPSDAGVGRSSK